MAAAAFPVRSQNNPGIAACTTDPDPSTGQGGVPANCVPSHQTLFIPNVTTDVGLSPPYNSVFTFFASSSTTAWTRRSRAAAWSSCRCAPTTR